MFKKSHLTQLLFFALLFSCFFSINLFGQSKTTESDVVVMFEKVLPNNIPITPFVEFMMQQIKESAYPMTDATSEIDAWRKQNPDLYQVQTWFLHRKSGVITINHDEVGTESAFIRGILKQYPSEFEIK